MSDFDDTRTPAGAPPPHTASEILSAAERLADEIRRSAQADAETIRARAGTESDAARAATAERVTRLSQLIEAMSERLAHLRAELDALGESLGATERPPAAPPDQAPPAPDGGAPAPDQAPPAPDDVAPAPDDAAPASDDDDETGARLVVLNMALSGRPRTEAARYVRENHQVADPERLADEVYATVER